MVSAPQGQHCRADVYELVCCECGDDPDLDYREVPAGLRQIRGPYAFAAGIAAYQRHVSRYHRWQGIPAQAMRGDRGSLARMIRSLASEEL